jgi:hypothetical protein
MLHNMILMYDGLDSRWEDDVDWDVLDPLDEGTGNLGTPNRAAILLCRVNTTNSDLHINRHIPGNETVREVEATHEMRRSVLVAHFDYGFNRKRIA